MAPAVLLIMHAYSHCGKLQWDLTDGSSCEQFMACCSRLPMPIHHMEHHCALPRAVPDLTAVLTVA